MLQNHSRIPSSRRLFDKQHTIYYPHPWEEWNWVWGEREGCKEHAGSLRLTSPGSQLLLENSEVTATVKIKPWSYQPEYLFHGINWERPLRWAINSTLQATPLLRHSFDSTLSLSIFKTKGEHQSKSHPATLWGAVITAKGEVGGSQVSPGLWWKPEGEEHAVGSNILPLKSDFWMRSLTCFHIQYDSKTGPLLPLWYLIFFHVFQIFFRTYTCFK